MQCELMQACIFFNDKMANMPSTAAAVKKQYCEKDFKNCARHMIVEAFGRGTVPENLFPNETEKAQAIIRGK